jgi:hypothetical protein
VAPGTVTHCGYSHPSATCVQRQIRPTTRRRLAFRQYSRSLFALIRFIDLKTLRAVEQVATRVVKL